MLDGDWSSDVCSSDLVPFYPSDFLVGTMFMSAEEVGAYVRLLCFQWQQGGIPQEEEKLARIAGIAARKLTLVLAKFEIDDDGLLKNRRMEVERVKVEATRVTKSKNGAKGGRPQKRKESEGKADENLQLYDSLAKRKQSETESESESETESSYPLNPPGGRESESERREGFSADETQTPPQEQTQAYAYPSPQGDPDSAQIHVQDPSLTTRREMKVEPSPEPPTRTHTHTPGWHPCAEQIQIGSWFNRRPSTVWSGKEQKVWKALRLEEEDLEILQWFYSESGCRYLRQDLLTLLNNWRGEVDRARNFNPEENRR
jgi:uncharacterized protein YdaU (DUF1376 family)